MATTIQYEHSAGVTLDIPAENLKLSFRRPFLSIYTRPDGTKIVSDPNVYQRVFSCTALLSGANVNTLNGWLVGSITYSGDYPRLKTVYLAAATTLTNIEVAITRCEATDLGNGLWSVAFEFTEKTQ